MRYVIFSRVSTNMQDTDNQIFECLNYVNSVKKDGDTVIQFDEQVKTTRNEMEKRPVLLEMLDFIKQGDTLVVYKLNRLARGHELALIHHIVTNKKKAQIVSLYEKEINEQIIHAYALVGSFERKNIQDNTRTALKRKQAKMEKVGSTWFGYKTDETILQQREKVRSTGKPYKLIPEKTEYQACNLMIEWRAKGLSYQRIAEDLSAQGYTNRAGKPFQKMTVQRVIKRQEIYSPALLA